MSSRKIPDTREKPGKLSRRGFIGGVGGGALATATLKPASAETASGEFVGPGKVAVHLTVNGSAAKLDVEPRVTLLDALRDQLDLTGAKASCDRGTCGSCTVLMNGKAVYACSLLAIDAHGKNIQTIESVSAVDPLIAAMVRNDATQCGFCAPGMVMATKAFLAKNPRPDEAQIAAGLGGNVCRCGAYVPIRKAIAEVSGKSRGGRNA